LYLAPRQQGLPQARRVDGGYGDYQVSAKGPAGVDGTDCDCSSFSI
jgi:hypothetical protein